MNHVKFFAAALVFGMPATSVLRADDVKYVEENGIRYQVTTQVVQRPINHTTYEPRETTTYRERYTTDMQEVHRTYQVPITQQQWVPGYQKTWNVFAPPVLSYRLVPVTHWETRTETVRVPSTRRELHPETLTQHVPVTKTHLAQEEHTHRVAVGVSPGALGGQSGPAPIASSNDAGGQAGGVSKLDDAQRDDAADQISRRR
jgi:hypothetical protein